MAEQLNTRPLRHRRGRRRAVGGGGGGDARRAGGADRERPDGRRMPQHRLRAVEGDDRRGQARRGVRDQRTVRRQAVRSPRVEFDQVNDHVHRVIDAIAPNDSKERFAGLRVRVIEGEARFRDGRTVVVGAEEDIAFEITGPPLRDRHRLAAGGAGRSPASSRCPYLTNENVFETRERPKHLIVLGAGRVGLELAQAFRRLGSEVTVLEIGAAARQGGPGMRRRRARCVGARGHHGPQRREGRAGAATLRQRVEVVLAGDTEETIQGTDLLIATGRRPNIAGLDLEAARDQARRPRHRRSTSASRTSNRRVYAIGDVTGVPQFTHSRQPSGRAADQAPAVPPAGRACRSTRSRASPSPSRSSPMSA